MKKLKVLHIGIEKRVKDFFKKIIGIELEFVELCSEREALEMLKYERFDIILIEEKLININGGYLADIITQREQEKNSDTTVFLISKNMKKEKYKVLNENIIAIPEINDKLLRQKVNEKYQRI